VKGSDSADFIEACFAREEHGGKEPGTDRKD